MYEIVKNNSFFDKVYRENKKGSNVFTVICKVTLAYYNVKPSMP